MISTNEKPAFRAGFKGKVAERMGFEDILAHSRLIQPALLPYSGNDGFPALGEWS
jgi:hypothetical protein